MKKTWNNFNWNSFTTKIKNETLCNSFEEGGLKDNDLNTKITSF